MKNLCTVRKYWQFPLYWWEIRETFRRNDSTSPGGTVEHWGPWPPRKSNTNTAPRLFWTPTWCNSGSSGNFAHLQIEPKDKLCPRSWDCSQHGAICSAFQHPNQTTIPSCCSFSMPSIQIAVFKASLAIPTQYSKQCFDYGTGTPEQ